jgi:hypothetical protein
MSQEIHQLNGMFLSVLLVNLLIFLTLVVKSRI